MSEDPQNSAGMPDEDPDTGTPIAALRELQQDTSPLFLHKLRRRIYRRKTTSDLLSASWEFPKIVFVELASMLIHLFSGYSTRKED